jgi:hypothetical protein
MLSPNALVNLSIDDNPRLRLPLITSLRKTGDTIPVFQ